MSDVERLEPGRANSSLERFEPQPLPEELSGLREGLEHSHMKIPFYKEAIERTVERVQSIVTEHGLAQDITKYEGYLESRGLSVQHRWITYNGHVIDLHLPVNDPEFPKFLQEYVFGRYISENIGVDSFLRTKENKYDLSKWVLGEFPDTYHYLGAAVAVHGIGRHISSRQR